MIGPRFAIDFREQIDQLLESVRPIASKVRELQERLRVRVELSCVAYISDIVPALYFTPEQLEVVRDLGATIDIDFMLVEGDSGRA